nr:hypothetical protein [Lachnospiraceae bacterium]
MLKEHNDKGSLNADKIITAIGMIYVILPIIIFLFGWLKIYLSLMISAILIIGGYMIWNEIASDNDKHHLTDRDSRRFWIITIVLSVIWIYLSGIGSLCYQNGDYWVRNPIFRDLSTLKWPVIYDLSLESGKVQEICGSSKVAFSYYFCFWLPVSAIAKLLDLGDASRGILISIWALAGVLLLFYLLSRKLSKCSLLIPLVFIFFSGLDIIPAKLLWDEVQLTDHLEWWATFFQYSSNTTQIFWVFNQSIPLWVLMALILQLKENRYIAALSALAFAYSPWATIGLLPIAAVLCMKKGRLKDVFSLMNIMIPLIMLIVFGSFYMGGNGNAGKTGLVFAVNEADNKRIFMSYLVFVLFEVLIYFFILGKHQKKNELYTVVLVELLILPLIVIRDENFIMRGSIPALFMLTFFVMQFLVNNHPEKDRSVRLRYTLLVVVLAIGCITPVHEISRTVEKTMSTDNMLQEMVGSFAHMQTEDEILIATARNQFFIYDYDRKFFFKYL